MFAVKSRKIYICTRIETHHSKGYTYNYLWVAEVQLLDHLPIKENIHQNKSNQSCQVSHSPTADTLTFNFNLCNTAATSTHTVSYTLSFSTQAHSSKHCIHTTTIYMCAASNANVTFQQNQCRKYLCFL